MFKDYLNTQAFRIYNPEEPNHPSKIFGGQASGIRNWDDLKYPVFLDYQQQLFGEYWVPEEVNMGKDYEQYHELLTEEEQLAYQYISGMLNWLDSMASDVVTLLFLSSSDPSLRSVLTIIASFETTHNRSYEHMTSTVLSVPEKEKAFKEVREIPILKERNAHIINKLEKMKNSLSNYIVSGEEEMDDETLQDLFEGLLAYQVLEGVYFSGGFVYFHSLARDNKMIESNNMINLIKADENQHSEIFGLLIQILMEENPQLNTPENLEYAMNYIRQAIDLEKRWAEWVYDGIDTLTLYEYDNYVEYLANLLCRNAGMSEPYPDNKEIKAKWIITYGSKKKQSEIASKSDFLQGNAINYKHEDGEDFDL